MNTIRGGLSSFFALTLLAGFAVLLVGLFSHANPGPAAPGSSPLDTPALPGNQKSPLPTPSVPLAKISPPVPLPVSGQIGLLQGSQGKLIGIVRKGDTTYSALFDPTTGEERKLADKILINIQVSSHWLVHEERSSDLHRWIKVLDLNTGTEIPLGSDKDKQETPSVSGNIVVWADWQDREKGEVDIYGYDLSSGRTFPVVVRPGVRSIPKISGRWVVYVEWPGQNPTGKEIAIELRAHSIETGEDILIGLIPSPVNASWGTYHALDDDKVAWSKVEADGQHGELHLYDLTTRTDRKLLGPGDGWFSDLSISARSGVIVLPGGGGAVLDWLQPTPTFLSVELPPPMKSGTSYGSALRVVGDYLVWWVALNPESSEARVFVSRITR